MALAKVPFKETEFSDFELKLWFKKGYSVVFI